MDNVSLFFQIFNLNGQFKLLDQLMIFGAVYLIYLLILFILLLSFTGGMKEKKAFLLILICLPVAFFLIKIIHLFFYEARPFITLNCIPKILESGPSFPSIHTTISSIFVFPFVLCKSKWSLLFLPVLIWIGISRVYVGVHYPLDIIGGLVIGVVSLLLAFQFKKLIFSRILKYP